MLDREGDFPVYQPLIDYLETQGYQLNENLFLFGYDWRRDVQETAGDLDALIDQVRGSGKVNIVAHSMGGLVSRNYILAPTRAAKVEHLVVLGTPFLGAPSSFKALYLGDDFGINQRAHDNGVPSILRLLDPQRVRAIAQNWPGIYELLPSQRFFQFYPQGYLLEDRDITGDGLASGALDYQHTFDFLNATFNPNLMNRAVTFHSPAMDGFTSATGEVQVSLFVGVGKPTPGQFRLWSETRFFDRLEIEHVSLTRWNGDGTVVQHAADLRDADTNLLGPATVYYVNEGHMGLTSNPHVLRQILSVFAGVTNPLNPNLSFSPDSWALAGDWVEVNSPVELNVYDGLGNHLGPLGGDIEYAIPGADYVAIGHDQSVFLPAGSPYRIALTGTGAGDFDLRLRKVTQNSVQTTVLFKDIPVITGAALSLSTDPDLGYTLELDLDNDGIMDEYLPPTSILDPQDSQDATPPESAIQIVGARDLFGFYTGPVTITLSAADETGGSGLASILYSLDGNPAQKYAKPFVINASQVSMIYVKAIDHAGNEESPLSEARLGVLRIFLPILNR